MTDTVAAMKKTVDQAATTAKAQGEQFKRPGRASPGRRHAGAERRHGKDLGLYRRTVGQSKQNLEALTASAAAAQKGVEALSTQAAAYSKSSWETGVAAAQTIAQAKSVQELIELQTNFAKSAMETYLSEVTKMTETLTASVKDSFKPINERVTASVEKLQAAR